MKQTEAERLATDDKAFFQELERKYGHLVEPRENEQGID